MSESKRTALGGLSRIQTRTVESVRTVRVKEDRPWGAEQNSDNTAVQVLEFRSPVVVPPVLNSYSEAFIDRRQIFDPETGQYQNSPESTALVIWGACRIRDQALGHAAKYCLSRTELNCQRPLTRSRLNVWCHAWHNSHRNWPWTAPVSG